DTVAQAIAEVAAGRPVIVVDDASRENEGDIIVAASKITPELMAFMIRHTSGVICAPLTGEALDRLHLPLMTAQNTEHMRTAFTVSVDARDGVTTGISAADRARTARMLADSATEPGELVRPGHIFPLRYAEGGVLHRQGHTEAAVDLARLAGLPPAGVLAEVVHDDGTMARLPALRAFADARGLTLISIAQLIEYRRRSERTVRKVAETRLPNRYGQWRALGYANDVDGTEHLALVLGDLGDGEQVLVRAHSECLTGDVFGSERCDCGAQLDAAMAAIAAAGRGVVLYLRGHEGRGIGLLSKLRAYQLQDSGTDTVDANLELGLPADAREYSTGAQILAELGVRSVRLLTNNPAKVRGLSGFGVEITARVALPVSATAHNLRYLIAKRDRLGHQIDGLPPLPEGAPEGAAGAPVPGGGLERAAGVASRRDGSYGGASGPPDRTTDQAGQPAGGRDRLPPGGVRDRLPPAGVRDRLPLPAGATAAGSPPVRAVPFWPADDELAGDNLPGDGLDADEEPGGALACQGGGPARRDG
ncbi:MAG: bifunctional 3,4-dihydroxy-2-butanone-4-phosphate synthase/GTP cyclohydrolase II, partial [Actinobacteria bacterium]|nr:bifunctional 3,4-dihydroxy-2-butanone-4-phosphate synthase/GTP cyclohydrolase II [Actinomycetota bacterium]